uniref:Dynamin N-terminal domain-containing protein n=1 Tax=Cyprinus carpio TaxID=7962 RepID=A0A8C2BSU6_CYPCA
VAFHNHLTESVQPLIELIDSLRLIGIEKDMDLPSIAVVGDQSSGKCSVLEALSGVALPRGKRQREREICTTFLSGFRI